MTEVVVTGGAGFLGSHIASRLVKEGYGVSIVDDFSAGSVRNLRDVGVGQKAVRGDLKDYEFARRSTKGADTVFHFAAEVGSVEYLHGSASRELAAMQANLVIDANVFRACLENKVKTVVYASSVSVYPFDRQQGGNAAFREEDSDEKVNPEGGYGWSKFVAEKQLSLMTGVRTGVARIFHAYGKNIYLDPDRSQVVGSLVRKAIRYPGEGFVVWGDGSQRRCFVYIDDALDGIFALWSHVEKKENLTVNIGSTEETSVLELARKVVSLSGKDIRMKFDPSKPKGALNRMPDLERARRVLGWAPRTPFDEGLPKTFEWARLRLGN
ncbi:MAG: NAD-dependent epimerase/dehydratase family protein [Nitrososphaerota archaeon]|nr:NAD-dependent epimerase/dehydratase family protein [Nitrososphaerota archaeon]MDG7023253.1 NAD-dependent epimerase/dehydratase family protein [Nitrososphaerota archaeon]